MCVSNQPSREIDKEIIDITEQYKSTHAVIDRVTFDESASARYIYVRPSRDLNVVEANIIGVRHGETIEVEP